MFTAESFNKHVSISSAPPWCLLHHVDSPVCVSVTWGSDGSRAMLCWETPLSWYSCGCLFETYHLHKHFCRPSKLLQGLSGLSAQLDNCLTARIVWELLVEHDKEFEVLTWCLTVMCSPHHSQIKLWDELEQQVLSMHGGGPTLKLTGFKGSDSGQNTKSTFSAGLVYVSQFIFFDLLDFYYFQGCSFISSLVGFCNQTTWSGLISTRKPFFLPSVAYSLF